MHREIAVMFQCRQLDATKFLHGEHEIEFHRPLKPGEKLTYSLKIVDVREAAGKRSGPMDIVVLETVVNNRNAEPVQTIRQTFVAKR